MIFLAAGTEEVFFTLGKPGFPTAVTKKSAFKPHR
jgi:hypothetical protein